MVLLSGSEGYLLANLRRVFGLCVNYAGLLEAEER